MDNNQAALSALMQISEQLAVLCDQQAQLLELLNATPETSLIDQLSELLQPLFDDMRDVREHLGLPSSEGRETTS